MSKRRAHRKSRGGCTECKRRHIKVCALRTFARINIDMDQCDEEKPQCIHCLRHNIPCVYRQGSTAPRDTLSAEDLSPQSDSSWLSIGSEDYASPSFDFTSAPKNAPKDLFEMRDMALLHHWITVAGYSILNTHELDHYWHSVIPSIGFRHQYVIHSILSLSALHIAHSRPSDKEAYLRVAAEHRSKALDGFTKDLHNVSSENSSALFANSTLTFFYAFISFSKTLEQENGETNARTAQILGSEWISLVRGTAAVLEPVHMHVREGPLRPFLKLHNFYNLDIANSTYASAFANHLSNVQDIWTADEHASVYDETLHMLLRCSAWMEQFGDMPDEAKASFGYNRFCSGPFIWLIAAPEDYIVLQQQRRPPALIIFAYYGALLHRLNSCWWAEGCGQSVVSAVDACLGPYWSSLLDWPKQTVGLD